MTQKELDLLNVGDQCKIIDNISGHHFSIGETVIYEGRDYEGDERFEALDGSNWWWVGPEDVEKKLIS